METMVKLERIVPCNTPTEVQRPEGYGNSQRFRKFRFPHRTSTEVQRPEGYGNN